ncbi:MAG: protein kinase [Marmoricola sp.]
MTSSMMPGTVLGGRYRLEDLLDDVDGARFWRATDTVLARSVAVHAIAETDPRVAAMLEAARTSATLTDPHLLRVLDADVRDGRAWVINEWGNGQSLDEMVSREVLFPYRAAWLVREVASAIAVAHGSGLAHGRLAPENVMVTESGTVRLIGFAIDAALQRGLRRSGNYPQADDKQADVFDLGGLLYVALVGYWPGASGSVVKPAPRDARGPLRPRQVRAGVPRPLDAICDRVLANGAPDRTAHELAAVLTEYIGELATTAPAVVPVTTPALPATDASLADLDSAVGRSPVGRSAVAAQVTDPPEQSVVSEPSAEAAAAPDVVEPTAAFSAEGLAEEDVLWDEPADPGPEEVRGDKAGAATPDLATEHPAPAPDSDPEATALVSPADLGLSDETTRTPAGLEDDTDWHQPGVEPAPPAPSLDPLPERPLFAPEGARRTPKGEVPRSETSDWGTQDNLSAGIGAPTAPAAAQGEPSWPFGDDREEEPDDWDQRTSRHWLRLPLVIAVLAVIAVIAAFALTVGGKDAKRPGAEATTTPSASSTPTKGQPLKISAVKDLDPFGVPPEENPDTAKNAIDNDPTTTWQTLTYRGRPTLGGLKPGVGLLVDLGSVQSIGSVAVNLVGTPTNLSLYAAPTSSAAPTGIEGQKLVATKDGAGEQVMLTPVSAVRARYVVVWLTSLPPVPGGFRGEIAGITVRS